MSFPAVKPRSVGKNAHLSPFLSAYKKVIRSLIRQSKKDLTLFADCLSWIDVSEGTITATEFFSAKLIFVENINNDKDSAVGFQKYELTRRGAMDVLGKIFSKYPGQRPFILDEIWFLWRSSPLLIKGPGNLNLLMARISNFLLH